MYKTSAPISSQPWKDYIAASRWKAGLSEPQHILDLLSVRSMENCAFSPIEGLENGSAGSWQQDSFQLTKHASDFKAWC